MRSATKGPPKHSQFKTGQSGNPRKRGAKPAKSLRELSLLEGEKRQRVRLNGKAVTLTQRQITIMAQWAKAMKGDPKAFQIIQAMEEDPKRKGALLFDPETTKFKVKLLLEEKPAGSYCFECGKALDAFIAEQMRELDHPTED